MTRSISIVHAPSPLGLKPQLEGRVSGVRRAPEALRAAGLHEALGRAHDVVSYDGEVIPPEYIDAIDPATNVRNPDGIAQYSLALADTLDKVFGSDDEPGVGNRESGIGNPRPGRPESGTRSPESAFILLLGGDCSILVGATLALRRRGRYGVVYIDAHPDYLTVEQSQTGGVAGMPLAIVTGLGPSRLTDLEQRGPYVDVLDTVVVASRDDYQVRGAPNARHVEGSPIRAHDLVEIRRRSPRVVAEDVMARMEARGVDGVWLHLDVDALDSTIMPAVDSPEPDGLSREEMRELLVPMIAHPLVRGLEVTIYDPDRDPDGSAARLLAGLLVDALAPLRTPAPPAR